MGKNPLKRSLIVGIILLFLSTVCLPVLASEGKPDLIIEDMVIYSAHNPLEENFNCLVKNIGNTSTPYYKSIDIAVTLRWKILNILPFIKIRGFTGGSTSSGLEPGESNAITFAGKSR